MSASAQKIPLHFVPAAPCLTGSHMGEEHPELQAQTQMKFRSCTQRLPRPNAEDPLLLVHQVSAPSRVWNLISGAPGKAGQQGSSHRTQQVQGSTHGVHSLCSLLQQHKQATWGEEPSPVPCPVEHCNGKGCGCLHPNPHLSFTSGGCRHVPAGQCF